VLLLDLLLFTLFFFLFGLFFGSFFLVVAERLPRGETILHGRSHCDHCQHTLAWFDLLPVISFVMLQGKCRYCGRRFGLLYPIAELSTGLVFAATFLYWYTLGLPQTFSSIVVLGYLLLVCASFLIIFFSDLRHGIIPFAIIAPFSVLVLLFLVAFSPELLLNHILAGLGAGIFFFLLFAGTKGRGMGFGDVVLVIYLGLIVGYPKIVLALYLGFLTGAIISLILIAGGKKKLRGSIIPFGPFLIIGALVSLFFGEQLIFLMMQYLLSY
jgi:leader peptidase (prepilin peptidase) / N-methyltransferase